MFSVPKVNCDTVIQKAFFVTATQRTPPRRLPQLGDENRVYPYVLHALGDTDILVFPDCVSDEEVFAELDQRDDIERNLSNVIGDDLSDDADTQMLAETSGYHLVEDTSTLFGSPLDGNDDPETLTAYRLWDFMRTEHLVDAACDRRYLPASRIMTTQAAKSETAIIVLNEHTERIVCTQSTGTGGVESSVPSYERLDEVRRKLSPLLSVSDVKCMTRVEIGNVDVCRTTRTKRRRLHTNTNLDSTSALSV